jgi:hypothetical protein
MNCILILHSSDGITSSTIPYAQMESLDFFSSKWGITPATTMADSLAQMESLDVHLFLLF